MRRHDESALVRDLLIAASERGVTLFRNNVGVLQDRHGHYVAYGLAVGSPDLVGWQPVTIGPEHLGARLAQFVGIEAKTETGRVSEAQRAFLAAMERAGAVSGVARSVADLDALLRR